MRTSNHQPAIGALKSLSFAAALAAACLVSGAPAAQAQSDGDLQEYFHSFMPGQDLMQPSDQVLNARKAVRLGKKAFQAHDYEAARGYFEQADKQDSAIAAWFLGHFWRRGLGVEPDPAKAFRYYRKAAIAFDPDEPDPRTRAMMMDAMWQVASTYRDGGREAGVSQDRRRAFNLFQQIANAGHAAAQHMLAVMYLNGEAGLARDSEIAMLWLRLAAEKRYAPASALLGDLHAKANEPLQALMWFMIAQADADASLGAYVRQRNADLSAQLSPDDYQAAERGVSRWLKRVSRVSGQPSPSSN